ncbi:MAG: hypothetical protein Fues2KO_10740 [Fuerstiella sp.]
MRAAFILTATALLATFTAGCSGEDDGRQEVFPVKGKVTVSGAPIAGASVSFAPRGDQPVAVGKTDDKGVYELTTYEYGDGAAAGEYEVLVTKIVQKSNAASEDAVHASMESGGGAPSHNAKGAAGSDSSSMVNEKYSRKGSGLTAAVTEDGPNEFDFDLDP